MSEYCREDENLEDLQRNGYRILQKKKGYHFGLDAVLLGSFARVKKGERALDLGTGCGVIPLLLEARTEGEDFVGLEIFPDLSDMAKRSVALNGLSGRIQIVNGDLKEASRIFGRASFDIVTCNPPYFKKGVGRANSDTEEAAARHEILCTFSDVARESARLLKIHGRLFLVHRAERLAEVVTTLQAFLLEPKRLRMVHPAPGRPAGLFLLEAVAGGNPGLTVEPPFFVYGESGVYSDEAAAIYKA